MKRFRLIAAVATAAIVTLQASPAASWGQVGHSGIGILAEEILTPAAAAEVRRLLAVEGAEHLSEVANWADQIKPVERAKEGHDAPMHSVRIPVQAASYDAVRDCTVRCAVRAIDENIEILSDRKKTDAERETALKYVVHLIGDLHQPLHASSRSGKEVVAVGQGIKLHRLWDTTIIRRAYRSPENLAHALRERVRTKRVSCGTAEEWANESHKIAIEFVYKELDPVTEEPIKLPAGYTKRALPVINDRIVDASLRLACTLNRVLS
jgi:hypothetical protein